MKLQGIKWLINCRDKSINNAEIGDTGTVNCYSSKHLPEGRVRQVSWLTSSVSTSPQLSHRPGSNLNYASSSGLVLRLIWGKLIKIRHHNTFDKNGLNLLCILSTKISPWWDNKVSLFFFYLNTRPPLPLDNCELLKQKQQWKTSLMWQSCVWVGHINILQLSHPNELRKRPLCSTNCTYRDNVWPNSNLRSHLNSRTAVTRMAQAHHFCFALFLSCTSERSILRKVWVKSLPWSCIQLHKYKILQPEESKVVWTSTIKNKVGHLQ